MLTSRLLLALMMILGFLGSLPAAATVFTVNSTGDEPDDNTSDNVCHTSVNTCTLRAAILQANATPGLDSIAFNISGGGVQTIQVGSLPLPPLTDTIVINGFTQPGASPNTLAVGYDAVLLIRIQGNGFAGPPGLYVLANGCVLQGLDVTGFAPAVLIDASVAGSLGGHAIQGNRITFLFVRAPGTLIGGTSPAQRNFILNFDVVGDSGVSTVGTLIQGNIVFGEIDVEGSGVTVGGPAPGAGNWIYGSGDYGIRLGGIHAVSPITGAVIQGNIIGLMPDGTPRGAPKAGIYLDDGAVLNTIGGVGPGEGNVIAFNGLYLQTPYPGQGPGIMVWNAGNTIRGNRIYGNGGLGIFLAPWDPLSPRPNDPDDSDSGPNDYQNYPILRAVTYGVSTTEVAGTLRSTPNTTFDIDFYSNPATCGLLLRRGFIQGENWIGTIQATTDSAGLATYDAVLPVPVVSGWILTATATNPNGSTSEFSPGLIIDIHPANGSAAGGTNVTITGNEFQPGATVSFGGVPGTNVTVAYNQITVDAPARPAGTASDVTVMNLDGSTGTLPGAWIVDFLDVSPARPDHDFVNKLMRNQVTAGCGGGNYCPDSGVTRAQMAVFLVRSKSGSCFAPPLATGGVFVDVPAGSFASDWIEELAARQVTAGCGAGRYCPSSFVTRAQMAVFLLRTSDGPSYVPTPCVTPTFSDVLCSSPFAPWIEELRRRGISAGCGGGAYCPSFPVTRGQMAVFLATTFALP